MQPQPPHTRQKYEQKYGPQTAEFALFYSIWGHILSRCLFIFLPCMWGVGVTSLFCVKRSGPFSGNFLGNSRQFLGRFQVLFFVCATLGHFRPPLSHLRLDSEKNAMSFVVPNKGPWNIMPKQHNQKHPHAHKNKLPLPPQTPKYSPNTRNFMGWRSSCRKNQQITSAHKIGTAISGPRRGTSKQHMKLQQPQNYDFRVSQFDPPRSRSGHDRETTTSPPAHH